MTPNTLIEREPGGFGAISRWLSTATPPVADGRGFRIPEGCQRVRYDDACGVSRTGLRSLRDRISFTFTVRGCRSSLAQPPANGWHPSGMAGHEPGGFIAISRWLRSNATIPPDDRQIHFRILEGCQRAGGAFVLRDDVRRVFGNRLRSLRDRVRCVRGFRGCRVAQPPANGWHPFGMAARVDGHLKKMGAVWK